MTIWERYNETASKPYREAAAKYLDEFDGKDKHRTRIALESAMPFIGDMPLIDVNDGALEKFKKRRFKQVMSGTVNKELTAVSTVLNRACRDWDWIPRVPRIRHVKGPTRKAYPLTWDEQDRLFAEFRSPWLVIASLFAINTGVRKGELFGLKWTDLVEIPEIETFVFILRETKNGQDRAVVCNSIARRCVDHMRGNGSEFVFPARFTMNGKACSIPQSGKVWSTAWLKAGLPADPLVRKGLHNTRHTFGQRLRAAEVPAEDRALLLGHSNASLVQHYAQGDIARLTEMAERVTQRRDSVLLR